jgi:hypothetical protein
MLQNRGETLLSPRLEGLEISKFGLACILSLHTVIAAEDTRHKGYYTRRSKSTIHPGGLALCPSDNSEHYEPQQQHHDIGDILSTNLCPFYTFASPMQ